MVVKALDLKRLESVYQEAGNQIVLVYGQADSEKEKLIKTFISDKAYFYYRCRQVSEEKQREMMGEEVAKQYGIRLQEKSYKEYFTRVKSNGPSKLVVVIDEAQFIMKKDEAFWSALCDLKAKKLYPGPVMIILTSSSIVWSQNSLLAADSKAKKQLDFVLKLENMSFLDVVRAFPNFSVRDTVALYGILGGVPGYMSHWDAKKNFKQNICELILSEDGYLFHKAEELISSELRELSVYNTILSAIAADKNKLNDLFLETGYSRPKISVYMKNLGAFDIVGKHHSFETGGWDNTKKGVYQITNPFVNFWYRFVFPHLSDLYILSPEEFYDQYIADSLDSYLNRYFIEVCKEYLSLLNQMGQLPFATVKVGSWIGKTGNLDIIAQSSDRRNIVGLCNWEKPVMTIEMVETLFGVMEKARVSSNHIYLFSATDFAPNLVEMAKKDARLVLIDMKEL